ncbi:hypothetical protein NM208_g3407 [Fusarium decemcellulare]|uniref:Uncharacterized protein n=1 Tax=Fusarium decemcellulare TaxID=57161 RepID=A0ACC1SP95_9HYPO|nr:hypothetical protein NM208_g3407 [Fusarium decemcellulare]
MPTTKSGPPSPPSGECIGLSWAALVIFGTLLFPTLYIAWRHGKAGKMCWPILVTFFIFRIISDAYYLAHRNEPDVPTTVAMMTSSACTATLSLTIIGLIYEALNLPLSPSKRWSNKAVLSIMHIVYTVATIMVAYGGSRDTTTPEGVKNDVLNKTGNVFMFLVVLGTLAWLWPAGEHIFYARQDVNYHAAKALMIAAAPSVVLQSIRLNYDLIYAFTHIASLHPTTGSFPMRFITFSLQLAIVTIALVAGWFSRDAARIRVAALELYSNSSLV